MKVTFKSGISIEVSQEMVNKLREVICKGANQFQFFTTNDNVILMINTLEVESITSI